MPSVTALLLFLAEHLPAVVPGAAAQAWQHSHIPVVDDTLWDLRCPLSVPSDFVQTWWADIRQRLRLSCQTHLQS